MSMTKQRYQSATAGCSFFGRSRTSGLPAGSRTWDSSVRQACATHYHASTSCQEPCPRGPSKRDRALFIFKQLRILRHAARVRHGRGTLSCFSLPFFAFSLLSESLDATNCGDAGGEVRAHGNDKEPADARLPARWLQELGQLLSEVEVGVRLLEEGVESVDSDPREEVVAHPL